MNCRLVFVCLVLALSVHGVAFAADEAAPPDSVASVVKPGSRSTLETYLFKSGGFIADKLQVYGKVVAAPAPGSDRILFGKNDYVYVDISQDYADQYSDYFIVEIGDKVKHPKTGKNMGKLITIIGQLRLIGQEAGYKKALITDSTREIVLKQPIIPSYVFQRPEDSETVKPGINGLIMKVMPLHLLGAQYQILYVDKGTDDGLRSGDMFTVMSTTKPISPIGKIKILSTQKNTATAYVIESKTSIFVGDTF
ncbi:hypothetical protein [Candidatus Magnetominusculus dajiuhuensis]|uniref:hypothetical protein n=1 Tax=Candidatus Magnetominusculus dajiuhuensis TaxID=3137712 RepID=UPI003B42E708